jgi:uncharacterized protein (TIGR02284 family)
MATMVGLHGDLKSVLRQLIEVDFDAVEAYKAAIDRIGDPEAKGMLAKFRADHERHTDELGAQLRQLGGEPPTGPDLKRVLTQGKVVIAGLAGDRAVLMAMKSNEDDTNTAYERATQRTDASPDLLSLLRRNLDDERRHREWIEQRLQQQKAAAHP